TARRGGDGDRQRVPGLVPQSSLVQGDAQDMVRQLADEPDAFGQRDEFVGWDHALDTMRPSYEGLNADDPTGRQLGLGLIVNLEAAQLDDAAQLADQTQPART